MIDCLKKLWIYPEIRSKLLVTLGCLFVFWLGLEISLPFFSTAKFTGSSGPESHFRMPIFSPVAVWRYVEILTYLMIAVRFIPFLRRRLGDGETRWANIRKLSYVVVLGLFSLEAFVTMNNCFDPLQAAGYEHIAYIAIALTLIAGPFLILFLARLVSLYGIASGIPLLLLGPMLYWLIKTISKVIGYVCRWKGGYEGLVVLGLAWIFALAMTVLIQEAYRNLSVSGLRNADRDAWRRDSGGAIRIKVDYAGAIGLMLGTGFHSALGLIANYLSRYEWDSNDAIAILLKIFLGSIYPGSTVYLILGGILILLGCHIGRLILFDPKEELHKTKKIGSSLPGTGQSEEAGKTINRMAARVGFVGALGVVAIWLIPQLVCRIYELSASGVNIDVKVFFFAAVVGMDGMRRIEACFRARGDEGPLTRLGLGRLADGESWDKRMPW